MKQLTNWFTNARKRIWKPLMMKEHQKRIMNSMRETEQRRQLVTAAAAPHFALQPRPNRANSESCVSTHHLMHARYRSTTADDIDAMLHASRVSDRVEPFDNGGENHPNYTNNLPPPRKRAATDHGGVNAVLLKRICATNAKNGVNGRPLPPQAVEMLKEWRRARGCPYPTTDKEKEDLCRRTGLNLIQLNNWFANNRTMLTTGRPTRAVSASCSPPSGTFTAKITLESSNRQDRARPVFRFNTIHQLPRNGRSQTVDMGQFHASRMTMQDVLQYNGAMAPPPIPVYASNYAAAPRSGSFTQRLPSLRSLQY